MLQSIGMAPDVLDNQLIGAFPRITEMKDELRIHLERPLNVKGVAIDQEELRAPVVMPSHGLKQSAAIGQALSIEFERCQPDADEVVC